MGTGITGEDLQMLQNRELWDLKNFSPLVAAREKCLHHLIPKFLKIENFKNQLNDPDEFGITPLHAALSECCDLSVFGAMVDSGADISKVTYDGRNALHFAVMNGCSDKIIILEIFHHANLADLDLVHSKDRKGLTPLHYAKEKWIIKILIKFEADPNVRDNQGRTPLYYNLKYYNYNVSPAAFTVFMNSMNTESLKFVDEKGDSLLHCVCYEGSHKFIPALLKAGIDPTLKNKEGDTPLHCALISRQTSCIQELLRGHPFLISILNKNNKCSLELAKEDDYKVLVKWVSLQLSDIVKNVISNVTAQDLKEMILEYFKQCLSDIQIMKAYVVIPGFTLYDIVKKSYLKPSELSWNQYEAALAFDDNLTVYGPEVSHVKAKVRDNIPKKILQIVGDTNVSESNKRALTSGMSQHSTLRPFLGLCPSAAQVRAVKVKVFPADSAAQVKAEELQQNTVACLITNVKNKIANERTLTSDLSQDSKIGPSTTQVKAKEMQENTLTSPLITVENEIVYEKAMTSDLSKDSVNSPSATQVKAGEVQQNTLILTLENEIVNERALTSDLSQYSEIGPSAAQDTAGEVQKNVVPADSTDPSPGKNGVKTNSSIGSVPVLDETVTKATDENLQRKEHDMAMKIFELKLKNETDIQLNHELAMKVFEMKLKVEQEKLKYYQSLGNKNRPEMGRRVHRFLIPCLVCMFCILYCIM